MKRSNKASSYHFTAGSQWESAAKLLQEKCSVERGSSLLEVSTADSLSQETKPVPAVAEHI